MIIQTQQLRIKSQINFDYLAYILFISASYWQPRMPKLKKVSPFIKKLYNILEDQMNFDTISWASDQQAFVIYDTHRFSTYILSKYFRHKNYSSFLRQLSFYNFTKKRCSNQNEHCYSHPLFKRGSQEKFHLIKRIDQKNHQKMSQQRDSLENSLNEEYNCQFFEQNKTSSMQQEFQRLKYRQKLLKEDCQMLLRQNKEIILDNYILKATMQDDSSSNKLILDRIQTFLMNYSSNYNINYRDFDIVKALLNFLDKKDWELILDDKPRQIMNSILGLIENNDIITLFNLMNSVKLNQKKKKKSYTIVKKNKKEKHRQRILKIKNQQFFQFSYNKNDSRFLQDFSLEYFQKEK